MPPIDRMAVWIASNNNVIFVTPPCWVRGVLGSCTYRAMSLSQHSSLARAEWCSVTNAMPCAPNNVSRRSICLLKNEQSLLPFAPTKARHAGVGGQQQAPAKTKKATILVFGDEGAVAGFGSGGVVMPFVSLVSEELSAMYSADEVDVTHPTDPAGNQITDPAVAAALAARADLVVVVVRALTSEGMDRTNLSLATIRNDETQFGKNPKASYDQDALVAAIAAQAGAKTVVVGRVAGAFSMPWLSQVAAVLYQVFPGQAGGTAAAGAIAGKVNPSGKLPVSFPTSIDATWLGTPLNPAQYPGITKAQSAAVAAGELEIISGGGIGGRGGDDRGRGRNQSKIVCVDAADWQRCDYSVEGMHVGYRWYSTPAGARHPPLFSFGHGLSYTTFDYSDLKVTRSAVTFTLGNSGAVAGAEVSQVYLRFPVSAGEPPLQLKGFAKTDLAAGATVTVTVPMTPREYSVWSVAKHGWAGVRGEFGVSVGSSSTDLRLHGMLTI